MSNKIKCLLLLAFFGLSRQFSFAQDSTVLSFDAFYEQVLKFHPLAKSANLLPQMAKMEIRTARGAFDPVISTQVFGKQTKGENSFTYIEPQIKLPTLIGVDIKAGMDQSDGLQVSNEKSKYDPVTQGSKQVQYQLFYAGVSVPVLRGLMTDPRRNALRQAQLLQTLNEAEQVSLINKLFLASAKDYWDWQQAYQKYVLMQQNFALADMRLNFIKSRISAGEEKPIDSVEAWVEYKRREGLLAEAKVEFNNAAIVLSNYLWDDNGNALQLSALVVPSAKGSEVQKIGLDSIQRLTKQAEEWHPDVQKLSVKLNQTELERKLALENLKPQLNLEYYPFQTYTAGSRDEVDGLFMKNYKFGATFYSSVFLRKERGKLQLTNYKIQQGRFYLQQGKREVLNQILTAYNDLNTLEQLMIIQQSLVQNASLLLTAEETRFESGESSLFLVNQRERSLIEARAKLVELTAKYAKAKYQLQWASGTRLF
jgi:outer membrane protein TolC